MDVSTPKLGTVNIEPTSNGYWEFDLDYAERIIRLNFNIGGTVLTQESINSVAKFLENLALFENQAITGISREYQHGSEYTVRLYIEEHLEQFSPSELLSCFSTDVAQLVTPDIFISRLKLKRIGLYPDQPAACAVFDYTIGDDLTNYILAVRFDAQGKLVAIEMESQVARTTTP